MSANELNRKLASVEDSLTTTQHGFKLELEEMRVLQKSVAEHHAKNEQAREDRMQKRMAEESNDRAKLLYAQVDEAEALAQRAKLLNRLVVVLIGVIVSSGGGIAYVSNKTPTDEEQNEQVVLPVAEAVKEDRAALEKRVDHVEQKTEVLKNMSQERLVQIADDGELTRTLIRRAHPRLNERGIDVGSVPEAQAKARAIKAAAVDAKKQLFDSNAVDPFAAIGE